MIEITSFAVARDDLARYQFTTTAADLADGEVLLAIDSFSFTANNITYAETGDVLRYWQFFPSPDGGIIPVWGFADVIESRHPDLAPRERLFGFWPMASHARLAPSRVDSQSVIDGAAHRRELPATYNGYQRCAADPICDPATEDIQSIFRGLFSTGFLIDDFLADRSMFGAAAVILSSASSKTAYSLAHQLHRRGGIEAIGLTSPANRDFVEHLGVYSRVLTYDQLPQIDPAIGAVFVDFAGSGAVRTAIHNHFADQLKYSMAVGMSHRDRHPPGKGLPGPRPEFFFAPAQRQKRVQDWGRDGFAARLASEWRALVSSVQRWLHITHGRGHGDVARVYLDTLRGSVPPDRGQILSL